MSKRKENRRLQLEQLLMEKGELSTKKCALLFNVSEETIRTDFCFLEEKGVLQKIHGKAILRNIPSDPAMKIRQQERTQAKEAIAKAVLPLIPDGATIYIDNASTSLSLGKWLRTKHNLTIVTNSCDLVSLLCESKHHIITLGGTIEKNGRRVIGNFAYQMLESFYFDIAILGMDGCANCDGPANFQEDEVALSSCAINHAQQAILLTDETKFHKNAYYQYAHFSQFSTLITTHLTKEEKARIPISHIIETEKEKNNE